ncbi:calmodulin-binding receptor-like cytoplasmic kinase 2 [Prunus yedoensis var. nudiflora]|uniref:Calmodulin-binding receptor-like cytoplasmic kinase 2 n=1 Tax=Prunus yedoensis var. nudiflora TaxID=2094558 RepID=A0A314UQ25_PRUYE|nr:calmodulin-binding receptor-like cytoplasmic kinase 2 [Prunus yedoensis var. nudiflora]
MSRNPSYGRRRPSSDSRSTPDRFFYSPSPSPSPSPSSSYSVASTERKSGSGRGVVAVAARSVAGVFVSCFTPPETKSSVSFADSAEFKAPSGIPFL